MRVARYPVAGPYLPAASDTMRFDHNNVGHKARPPASMCRMQNDPLETKRPRMIKWALKRPQRKKKGGLAGAYYRHLSGGRCVRDRRNLRLGVSPFTPAAKGTFLEIFPDVTARIIASAYA